MKKKVQIGAVLLALALLPAAAFFPHHALAVCMLLSGVAGVTVTYASFQDGSGPHLAFSGGVTPPTAAQSQTVNAVVADVVMLDAETTATITHNLAVSTRQLAALQPYVTVGIVSGGTAAPVLAYALTDVNTVTLNKTGTITTGTGGTYRVVIRRPHSLSS